MLPSAISGTIRSRAKKATRANRLSLAYVLLYASPLLLRILDRSIRPSSVKASSRVFFCSLTSLITSLVRLRLKCHTIKTTHGIRNKNNNTLNTITSVFLHLESAFSVVDSPSAEVYSKVWLLTGAVELVTFVVVRVFSVLFVNELAVLLLSLMFVAVSFICVASRVVEFVVIASVVFFNSKMVIVLFRFIVTLVVVTIV